MSYELKPCPFCGSTNVHIHSGVVFCRHCLSIGPGKRTYDEDNTRININSWNARAGDNTVTMAFAGTLPAMVDYQTHKKALAEIDRLMDYSADLLIIIRAARKMLKLGNSDETMDVFDRIREARKILKEGLKEE